MDNKLLQQRAFQILRAIWVILIVTAICLAIYFITPLVLPFIIGWLIAYIVNPLVNLLVKRAKFPRWLASTTGLILFFGVAIAIITLIISKIVVEIGKFSRMVSENIEFWIKDIVNMINSEWLQNLVNQVLSFYSQNEQYQQTINQEINNLGERLANAVSSFVGLVIDGTILIITSLPNLTFITIIAILAAFFISKDWYHILHWLFSFFPEKIKTSTLNVWKALQSALFGYVRAQLIMISITAVFVIIGLMILGVNYALTIGLLIGLVDLLPYLGVGLVMVPWIIYAFIKGDLFLGIGLAVIYGIVYVVRSIIEPKVLASSIGLNALATLIAMFIGLKLFGVIGILIGPVTLVFLLTLNKAGVFRDVGQYIKGKQV